MIKQLFHTAVACITLASPLYGAEWLTDMDTAKAEAKATGKAILVDFTGSDWCGWCVRLRSMILDSPAFQDYARDKFVFMEVDMPRNVKKIGEKQHAINKTIANHYNVNIYPTILVLNHEGDVMGGFIGGRDTLEHVIRPLDAALHLKQETDAARQCTDIAEKTNKLSKVYSELDSTMKPYFRTLRDEIASLDTANATGIHDEIRDTTQIEQLEAKLADKNLPYKQGMTALREALQQASAKNKEKILMMCMDYAQRRQNHLVMTATSIDDVMELKAVLLEQADFASEGERGEIRSSIEAEFSNPQEILEMLILKRKGKK
jgi:thioredoxin-related protein